MIVIRTARLELREFVVEDAKFIRELLNEPAFLRYIGDKGVRNMTEARNFIESGPVDSYQRHGFGLYATCLRKDPAAAPLGMCGLVKRQGLPDPDLGFAFLQRHWGVGYALESAAAVFEHGLRTLDLPRIAAITSQDNAASVRVLEKVGFKFDRMIRLTHDGDELKLFGIEQGSR